MKKRSFLALTMTVATLFLSCSSDDDNNPIAEPIKSQKVSDLYAPQTGGREEPAGGAFTKFDFKTGKVTTSDTEWDVAFRGTSIAVNGGTATGVKDEPQRNGDAAVAIATGTFEKVTSAEGLDFKQDSDKGFAIPKGASGWYDYNMTTHIITAIPGRVLVFRTQDGDYAKMEILSYYKDAPSSPTQESVPQHYTFNYVYNPNKGDTALD